MLSEPIHSQASKNCLYIFSVLLTTIWSIVNGEELYPHHMTPQAAILADDYERRKNFSTWITNNTDLLKFILFTDKSIFQWDGIFNSCNEHLWAEENLHSTRKGYSQYRFKVNIWEEIIHLSIIGPHFFEGTVNGNSYLKFICENLKELIVADVSDGLRREMIFMHD